MKAQRDRCITISPGASSASCQQHWRTDDMTVIRDIVDRIGELIDEREKLEVQRDAYRHDGEVDAVIEGINEELHDWDEANGATLKGLVKELHHIVVEEDEYE
jgi:hypothetical protein